MEEEVLAWRLRGRGKTQVSDSAVRMMDHGSMEFVVGLEAWNSIREGEYVPSKPVRSRRAWTWEAVRRAQVLWVGEREKQ